MRWRHYLRFIKSTCYSPYFNFECFHYSVDPHCIFNFKIPTLDWKALFFLIKKMSLFSLTTLAALSTFLVSSVSAFSCKINGIKVECPSFSDKPWCCDNYCCDFDEYTKRNSGPPTGMIVAFVVISVIFIVGGCCCYIARRKREEQALYGLETDPITAVPNARYPHQVHPPPINPYGPSQPAPYPQQVPYQPPQPLPYEPPPPYEVAPPYPAGQPPYTAGQPPYPTGHPPYPAGQTPYPVEQQYKINR